MTPLLLASLLAAPPDDAAAALALARAARTRPADAPIAVVHSDAVPQPMPPAVCRVDVPGRSAVGSGTVVACEGGLSLVVTNRHVVPDRGGGVVVTLGGTKYAVKYHAAHPDPAVDLALLTVAGELPTAEVGDAEPAAGTELRQWGYEYRGGGKPVPKHGRAVAHAGANLHSTMPCESGDSGCGVFDDRGRLVGVNHGYVGTPGNRGDALAVRLNVLRAFLRDRAGAVFPKLAGRLGGPPPPAAAPTPKPSPEHPVEADAPRLHESGFERRSKRRSHGTSCASPGSAHVPCACAATTRDMSSGSSPTTER